MSPPDSEPSHIRLTRREREIVTAILDGCTNHEIARRFTVSEQTVKNYLSSIYNKVGVSSRLELALVAIQRGLIESDTKRRETDK